MSPAKSDEQAEQARLRKLNAVLAVYREINEQLLRVDGLEETAAAIIACLLEVFGAEGGNLFLLPGEKQVSEAPYEYAVPPQTWRRLPPSERRALVESILQELGPIAPPEPASYFSHRGLNCPLELRDFLALPLRFPPLCQGAIFLYNFADPQQLPYYQETLDMLLSPLCYALHRARLGEAQEREARLRHTILENTSTLIACLDRDFQFVEMNSAYLKEIGRRREALLGSSVFEVFPSAGARRLFERVRESGKPVARRERTYIFPGQPERGRTYWNWSLAPVKDAQGKVDLFVLSLSEVTESVKARHQIVAAEKARARENRLLEAIFENTKAQLVYLDRDFNFVKVNSAYAETCRRPREAFIGHNHFEFYPHEENQAIFARVRDTGEPVEFHEKPFDFPDQPERGTTYWDWTLIPVKDERGAVEGLVFSLLEVTDQVRIREHLVEMERARARQAEILASEVDHRVKNNLAIIAGLLHLQAVNEPENSRSALLLRDAITRIQTLSAIHGQMYERREQSLDLLEAIRRIAHVTRQALSEGELELVISGDSCFCPSKVITNLGLVINELLTNALKHGGPGDDSKTRITVTLSAAGEGVVVKLWNSGNPIAEDSLRLEQNTLGLKLVRALVEEEYRGTFTLRPLAGGTLAEIAISPERLQWEAKPKNI